jgi:hypothetical protein
MLMSCVTELQALAAVNLYVREVAGVKLTVPLCTARLVTCPVERSVIEPDVVLEMLYVKVTLWPALMVVALAEKVLMDAGWVTVTAKSCVTEPAPLVTVRR